jgi:hypothetical protein
VAIDKKTAEIINSWIEADDVGGLNQWLDTLQKITPVAAEHGLSKFEGYSLAIQIQGLYKLTSIRDLLQEIVNNDIGKGDTPT